MPKTQQMLLITIKSAQRTVDLELPGDEPIQNLVPVLIDICGLYPGIHVPVKQVATFWWPVRVGNNGRPLQLASTLCDNGVLDGDIAFLQAGAQPPAFLIAPATPASRQTTASLQPGEHTGWIGIMWGKEPLL